MPKRTLTDNKEDREKRFAEEYLVDLNASGAYSRAFPGVTEKTAATEGSRLLGKPEVQAKIAAAKAERSKRTHVTQDKVIKELSRIGFLDVKKAFKEDGTFPSPSELPNNIRRAIRGFEVQEIFAGRGSNRQQIGTLTKVKFESKVPALALLLEHVKIENEKAADSQPVNFTELAKKARTQK
jgi:phage terminase small subunit